MGRGMDRRTVHVAYSSRLSTIHSPHASRDTTPCASPSPTPHVRRPPAGENHSREAGRHNIGAFLMALTRWELAAWTVAAMVVGDPALLSAVLFAHSEAPANRLRALIHAWRNPTSIRRPGWSISPFGQGWLGARIRSALSHSGSTLRWSPPIGPAGRPTT